MALWYVSTYGSPTGAGTIGDPWTLSVAFDGGYPSGAIDPGDTIIIRGGVYGSGGATQFYVDVSGTSGNLVTFIPYPNEHVVIDGSIWPRCHYIRFINREGSEFEIRNSDWTHAGSRSGQRWFDDDIGPPPQKDAIRLSAEYGTATGIEVINLVIHDTRGGVYNQSEGAGGMAYGCIVFNCGYQKQDRGHGHGFYWQNPHSQIKYIQEYVSSHGFAKGGQIYGDTADLANFRVKGLAFCNADFIWNGSGDVFNAIVEECTIRGRWCMDLYSGYYWPDHDKIEVKNNKLWGTIDNEIRFPLDFGPFDDLVTTGNRIINEDGDMILSYKRPASGPSYPGTWNNNDYYGNASQGQFTVVNPGDTKVSSDYNFSGWQSLTGYDSGGSYTNGLPTGIEVEVRPNDYEIGRGHIIIHNWDEDNYVTVNLSTLGYSDNDTFEIRNVLNYFGDTPITGQYDSGNPTISLDMRASRWTYARPIGASDAQRALWPKDDWGVYANAPWPTFGIFVIRRTGTGTTGQVVFPTGIVSGEAFGTPYINMESPPATVYPVGIPSGEAFGVPTILGGEVIVEPTGIPSAEAFGTPYVLKYGLAFLNELTLAGSPEGVLPVASLDIPMSELTLAGSAAVLDDVAAPGPAEVKAAVTRVACNTVTGNQDITTEALGDTTPKAALFLISNAVTDGSAVDHHIFSIGAATGTSNRWSTGTSDQTGVGTTNSDHRGMTDQCIHIQLPGSHSIDGEADFVAFINNGVRINWDVAPDSAYLLTVVFFGGDDVEAYAGTWTGTSVDNSVDVTAPGFEPDLVICASHYHEFDDLGHSDNSMSFGFCHNGASDTHRCIAQEIDNGDDTSDPRLHVSTAYVSMRLTGSGSVFSGQELGSFDSQGFSATTKIGGAVTMETGYLALKLTDADVWVGSLSAPDETGDWNITDPGFLPQFVIMGLTFHDTMDSGAVDARAGVYGISAFNLNDEYCTALASEDNETTTDTQSISDNQAVNLPNDGGALGFMGTFSSFHSNGWTLNFTNVDATVRRWIGMAIEFIASGVFIPMNSITLTGSTVFMQTDPGPTSVPMNTLTLTSSAVFLDAVPGEYTVSMAELIFVGAVDDLAFTRYLDMDELTLASSAPSILPQAIQYARPDGDISVGQWTDEGDGTTNIYQSIDEEVASDSDYIKSEEGPIASVYECSIQDIDKPGVGTGHKVKYRYRKDVAGAQVNLKIYLMQGAVEIASWTETDIPLTFTDGEQTLTTEQANSITDYDDLRLKFEATQVP